MKKTLTLFLALLCTVLLSKVANAQQSDNQPVYFKVASFLEFAVNTNPGTAQSEGTAGGSHSTENIDSTSLTPATINTPATTTAGWYYRSNTSGHSITGTWAATPTAVWPTTNTTWTGKTLTCYFSGTAAGATFNYNSTTPRTISSGAGASVSFVSNLGILTVPDGAINYSFQYDATATAGTQHIDITWTCQ